MKKRMLADDIGGRDISEDSARRDSRNSKHKFLHDCFPFGNLNQVQASHNP